MASVVCCQVSLIKTTIWAALHHLFPGAFFFLPQSKRLPLIALSGDVSEAHRKEALAWNTLCTTCSTHTRRDPSQALCEVPLIVTSQRDSSVPNFTVIYPEHKTNISIRLMVQKGPLVGFRQFGAQRQRVFNGAPWFTTKHIRLGFSRHTPKIKGNERHTGPRRACTCCRHGPFLSLNNTLVELGKPKNTTHYPSCAFWCFVSTRPIQASQRNN